MKNTLSRISDTNNVSELTSLAKMEQSDEQTKMLQESQEALDTLKKEVGRLSGQVNDAPQVLLELAVQLQTVQQDLATETSERNIAIDNMARKLELASSVFNTESKLELRDNDEMSIQRSEQQLSLIRAELDSLANTQLSAIREQIANCNKQFSLEQAERKSDSEMVWSSMQSLHGHLVQFISQPPVPQAPQGTPAYAMPESQRSLGGSRMPRSRSPSPRMPPTPLTAQEMQAARPRTQLLTAMPPATTQLPANIGNAGLVRNSYPAPGSGPATPGSGRPMQQVSWTQPAPQEMTPGQNISFARHLLKS